MDIGERSGGSVARGVGGRVQSLEVLPQSVYEKKKLSRL